MDKKTINILIGVIVSVFICCLCLIIISLVNRNPTATPPAVLPTAVPFETLIAGTLSAAQTQTAITLPQEIPPQVATVTLLSTETPISPPLSNIGVIGERKEAGGIALTVFGVSKTDSINEFLKPEAGNTYLVIEVLIENVNRTDDPPYNPLYFSVKDSDGFQYTSALLAPDPSLQSGTLPLGDKVRGMVAFEVKITATGFIVTYEPLVILGGYEPIRINLGQ